MPTHWLTGSVLIDTKENARFALRPWTIQMDMDTWF